MSRQDLHQPLYTALPPGTGREIMGRSLPGPDPAVYGAGVFRKLWVELSSRSGFLKVTGPFTIAIADSFSIPYPLLFSPWKGQVKPGCYLRMA